MFTQTLHRAIGLVTILSFCFSLFGFWSTAYAQTDNSLCVIDGVYAVTADSAHFEDQELEITAMLENQTSYNFAGVRLSLGLYSVESNTTVPVYWTMLSDEYQLLAGQSKQLTLSVDASAVPAGEYQLVVYAGQGTTLGDVFGKYLAETTSAQGGLVLKEATAAASLAQELLVGGTTYQSGDRISTDLTNFSGVLKTQNDSERAIFSTTVHAILTAGEVPVGGAVVSDTRNSIKLIAGGTRDTALQYELPLPHTYTLYVLAEQTDRLLPIGQFTFNYNERDVMGQTYSYLTQVGTTDVPVTSSTQVAACVGHVGLAARLSPVPQELMVSVETRQVDITPATYAQVRYAVDSPALLTVPQATDGPLYVRLRDGSTLLPIATQDSDVVIESGVMLDAVELQFTCGAGECDKATPSPSNHSPFTQTFWFYLGVTLAAALLMYIIIRRMHPDSTHGPQASAVDQN